MALNLRYRSTFIDAVDEPSVAWKRSASEPPKLRLHEGSESDERMQYVMSLAQQVNQLHHVQELRSMQSEKNIQSKKKGFGLLALPDKACQVASRTSTAATPRDMESDFESLDISLDSMELNPGSVGHPEVCRRPCIYFAAGHCSNGSDCGYCHLDHTHRPRHLDKRQRDLISKCSEAVLLSMLTKHLHQRAADTDLTMFAAEILGLMERWIAEASSVDCSHHSDTGAAVPLKLMVKLDATLSKLPFSALLTMALHSSTSPTSNEVAEALTRMREKLAMTSTHQRFD